MPEQFRALIVILVFAGVVFAFAKSQVTALAMKGVDFSRRRNLWFAITLIAFLAHDFWLYIICAAVLLLFAGPREPNKLALFFFIFLAVPGIKGEVPGLGVIRFFFDIDYKRLLALAILLPAFLYLRNRPDVERFGRFMPDKLIAGYMVLNFVLILTTSTFSNTLRHGLFYSFIDTFLPYYVASRSLKNLQGFRDAMSAFVMAALVLSPIVFFEFAKSWLVYSPLLNTLGVYWGGGRYLTRGAGGSLRAVGSAGHAIALGYFMAVATGFLFYVRRSIPNPMAWTLGLLLLIAGLIAPLSRGPWVGAAAMLLIFVATGPSAATKFTKLGLLGAFLLPVLLVSPLGKTIIDHLPFVGTVDADNVVYRERLLAISFQVMMRNPFFGAFDSINALEMQELMAGGIIDIVNTYVAVAMTNGLVGLSLFLSFFIAIAFGIFKGMRTVADRNDEVYLLGRVLLSTLLGTMIIIFTVSSVTIIPVIYWSVAGLGVAYARMTALAKAAPARPESARSGSFHRASGKIGGFPRTGNTQNNSGS